MIGPVVIGLAAGSVAARTDRRPWLVGCIAAGVLVAPQASAAVAFLTWAIIRFRRAAAGTRAAGARERAALEAVELVALGLAGGLSVAAAHRLALVHAPDPIVPALESLCKAMRTDGVGAALAGDRGPLAGSSDALTSATASGAPVLPALEAHLRQQHHQRHTVAVERARRLPIRLLLPLTLLVLPGFVLITVGPAVIDSLARLGP